MARTRSSCSLWGILVGGCVLVVFTQFTNVYLAACFLGALQLIGSRAGKKEIVENAKVNATVFLGHPTDPNLEGFGLRVEITVEGCDDDALIQAAHEVCSAILSRELLILNPATVLPLQPCAKARYRRQGH